MIIKKITWQNRRDFSAIMICDHCGKEDKLDSGYDDYYYHSMVIPNMECKFCGKKSKEDYNPIQTKYPEGMQI